MKYRFQDRLQVSLDDHLGNPVGDRRYPERPGSSSIAFRYVNATHGWRKVAAGSTFYSRSDRGSCSDPLSKSSIDWPSTPAAPRLAFTCLYASHTSRLAIQNGFALSMVVIPFRVAAVIKPDDDAPSVRPHYRTIDPTMGVSAPVPRIGTQTLAATDRLGFSLHIRTTGSCVPYRSLS